MENTEGSHISLALILIVFYSEFLLVFTNVCFDFLFPTASCIPYIPSGFILVHVM